MVTLRNVSIFYGDRTAVEDASFTIEPGERVALCGPNGCGKSSLLKLVLDDSVSYHGDFYKNPHLVLSYVSQGASHLHGSLSDYAQRYAISESQFKTILRKLDFSREQFDQDIEYFSSGQKKKVMLARSLCEKAHLYIWDEPLNFIDVISRIQIEELLLAYQPTLLFVEHDLSFLSHIATKTVDLSAR